MATTTPGFTSARATRPQQLFATVTDDQARLSFPSTTSANIAVNTLIGNVATVNSSNITINTTTLPGRITVSGNLNYSLTAHGTANLDLSSSIVQCSFRSCGNWSFHNSIHIVKIR